MIPTTTQLDKQRRRDAHAQSKRRRLRMAARDMAERGERVMDETQAQWRKQHER